MTRTDQTQEHLLGYADGMDRDALHARVFGHLVRLAQPHLEHFQSDLFHDAMWLHYHLGFAPGDVTTFYWSHDTSGTVISADPGGPRRQHAYTLTLAEGPRFGKISLHITREE